jgi:hypothetical protein
MLPPAFPPGGRPQPQQMMPMPPQQMAPMPPQQMAPEPVVEAPVPEPEPEPEPVDPEVARRDRDRRARLQAPITRSLLGDDALFAEVSKARGAADVEVDELLEGVEEAAAEEADDAAAADDAGDDDMYGDLGGGDDDLYGDLGGNDAGDAPMEEAVDAGATELPVVQALGQLEAHSARQIRSDLAPERRAAHRAYLLEALTSAA